MSNILFAVLVKVNISSWEPISLFDAMGNCDSILIDFVSLLFSEKSSEISMNSLSDLLDNTSHNNSALESLADNFTSSLILLSSFHK